MQIQQQKFKPEVVKALKIEILQPQIAEMTRTFSNPVCRQTYDSLPKIYGKKKRVKLHTSPIKQDKEQIAMKTKKRYFSSNQGNRNPKMKRADSIGKSVDHKGHSPSQCQKKNCSFHIYTEVEKQNRTKFSESQMRRIILPQIRKFDLQDLQSRHKVSFEGTMNKTGFGGTGLQKIIEQNQKVRSKIQVPDKNNQQEIKGINFSKGNINQLKNKHKFKPKINSTKFQIEQQSDDEQRADERIQNKKRQGNKHLRTQSRYKTEVNDSESPKSSNNSISLTSLVFKGTKRQNTNFYDLNKSQKSIQKKLSRKPSQLSNGLFRIPEQPEYQEYLNNYHQVNQNFDLKKIANKTRFKIQKHEKGVYFGEMDQQFRKHGQGINITQKQIFQGKYERDVKTSGSERNIDGVYTGEFVNGKRQGHGVFKWNNGQIFEGRWENGMKNGFGIWRSPKGDYYEGQWSQNRQHGQGLFKHRISTYKGQFKNFLKDGYGQETFANGDKYIGAYKDGKPHGNGRYEWFKGSYYDGQFVQGMRQGKGKWVDEHSTVYEGQFKLDFKHGYGKQTYASGEKYEGQFRQGTRTNGKLYDKNNNFIQVNGK